MLRSFGALITFAATTDEASRALQTAAEQHQPFDMILSDISRDLPTPDPTAGLTMLPRLRNAGFHQPVIYYVGRPNPDAGVPAGAFGVTNRPDQLLQLVIDALSRVRGKAATMKAIEDFPFDWIAKDLREGKCIPFLGAGASAFPKDINAKPPSAAHACLGAGERVDVPAVSSHSRDGRFQRRRSTGAIAARHGRLRKSDARQLLGRARPRRSTAPGREAAQHIWRTSKTAASTTRLHDLLARVAKQSPMAIITTNYDDLDRAGARRTEGAFRSVCRCDRPACAEGRARRHLFRPAGQDELKPVTGEQQLLDFELDGGQVRLKRTVLFKIHGHIDRTRRADDTFVITEEDYVSFLGRMRANSVIPADLVDADAVANLAVPGYGLRDWNFRVLLDRLNRSRLQPKQILCNLLRHRAGGERVVGRAQGRRFQSRSQ